MPCFSHTSFGKPLSILDKWAIENKLRNKQGPDTTSSMTSYHEMDDYYKRELQAMKVTMEIERAQLAAEADRMLNSVNDMVNRSSKSPYSNDEAYPSSSKIDEVCKGATSRRGVIRTDLSNIGVFQADANLLMVAGKDISAKAFGFGFEYGYGVKYNVFGGKLSENGIKPTLGEPLVFFKLGNSIGGFNYEKSIYSGKVNFRFKIGVVEFSKSRGADIVLWDLSAAQGLGVNSKGTLNLIHTFIGYSDMQQKFYDVNGHMCPIIP